MFHSQRRSLSCFQPRSFSVPILVTGLSAPISMPMLPKMDSLDTSAICSHHRATSLFTSRGSWAREEGEASHRGTSRQGKCGSR